MTDVTEKTLTSHARLDGAVRFNATEITQRVQKTVNYNGLRDNSHTELYRGKVYFHISAIGHNFVSRKLGIYSGALHMQNYLPPNVT